MAALKGARYLHEDAFKRFTAGNRSLKHLSEYMEERARIEMEYSAGLDQLAARWSRKLSDTIDFEYQDFRRILREVFGESTSKAQLHDKAANKILNEATMLKKQHKDHFKREAQDAIVEKYNSTMDKQKRLEEKTEKAKKKYFKKKDSLDQVKALLQDHPHRQESSKYRDSSSKYQELVQKRTHLTEQVADAFLKYEGRYRVETTNREEFARAMTECESAYDEQEVYRLRSARDRVQGMLGDLANLEGKEREACQEKIQSIQAMLRVLSIKDSITTYTQNQHKLYTFPRFQEFQGQANEDSGSSEEANSLEIDSSMEFIPESSLTTYTSRDAEAQNGGPLRSPVMAWGAVGSDEDSDNSEHALSTPGTSRDVNTAGMNVRVVAIRAYKAKRSTELSFEKGQTIKQKLPANIDGWAYGWIRPNPFVKRRFGIYPGNYVKQISKKE